MATSTTVTFAQTEDLNPVTRAAIIQLCIDAHQEEDFKNLFSYIPSGGRHFLVYRAAELVSHAVVTTRRLQPEGQPVLKTAYVDAVSTLPAYQSQGYGRTLMAHLAKNVADYELACLETDVTSFYARSGWEVWRGPLRCRKETALITTPIQNAVMILRLAQTPPLDLDGSLTVEFDGRIW